MQGWLYLLTKRGKFMEYILKIVIGVVIGAWLCRDEDIEAIKDIIKGNRTLM